MSKNKQRKYPLYKVENKDSHVSLPSVVLSSRQTAESTVLSPLFVLRPSPMCERLKYYLLLKSAGLRGTMIKRTNTT